MKAFVLCFCSSLALAQTPPTMTRIDYKNLNVDSCKALQGKSTADARRFLELEPAQPNDGVCTIVAMLKLSLSPEDRDISLLSERLGWVVPIDPLGPGSITTEDDLVPASDALGRYGKAAIPQLVGIAASGTATPRTRRSAVITLGHIYQKEAAPKCAGTIQRLTATAAEKPAEVATFQTTLTNAVAACSNE